MGVEAPETLPESAPEEQEVKEKPKRKRAPRKTKAQKEAEAAAASSNSTVDNETPAEDAGSDKKPAQIAQEPAAEDDKGQTAPQDNGASDHDKPKKRGWWSMSK